VRPLCSSDHDAVLRLEAEALGTSRGAGSPPRDHDGFVALADGRLVGVLRCHVRDRDATCTAVVVRPEFQRTRVTPLLIASFVRATIHRVGACGFLIDPADAATRALGTRLGGGAHAMSDVVSPSPAARRAWYARVGLVPLRRGAAA
jgi:hypothetical protein